MDTKPHGKGKLGISLDFSWKVPRAGKSEADTGQDTGLCGLGE